MTSPRASPLGVKPFIETHLKTQTGLSDVVKFIESKGMLLS